MKTILCTLLSGFILDCPSDTDAQKPVVERQQQKQITTPAPIKYYRETQAGNYLSSQFAQRRHDWKKATQYISKVILSDPDNVDLQKRAMVLAMGSGEIQRAIAYARQVLKNEPDNFLAVLFVALDQSQTQNYADIPGTLDALPKDSIVEFIRPVLMAWARSANNEFAQDMLDIKKPLHVYHAIMLADYLGLKDKVNEYLDAISKQASMDIYETEVVADIYLKAGRRQEAEELYTSLLKRSPDNVSIQEKIQKLSDEAPEDAFVPKNLIRHPGDGIAEAFFDMARILSREYSDDSVIVFAQMALHLNPDLTEAKILLAHTKARNERYAEAISHYKSITPDNHLYLDIQRRVADLFELKEQPTKSIAHLQKLYDDYSDIEALIKIGDVHRRQENFEAAIVFYDSAVNSLEDNLNEEHWELLYSRGKSYERTGQWESAEKDLQKALEYNPDHPYILNYLGYSWADRGENLSEALGLIQKAVDLRPDDGYIADSLGWVFYKLQRYDEALPHLETAAELLPYDPVINDHLGDLYWRLGRKTEAKFQWTRALNHADEKTLTAKIEQKLASGLPKEKETIQHASHSE